MSGDFRSDTITTPLPEMVQAVANCEVGDNVYGEDKQTAALEARLAALTGHEMGLFCVSGTLSNQIAIRTHLKQPPHSIVCDSRAHIYRHEAGGIATLSQAMVYPSAPSNGKYVTLDDIKRDVILEEDVHYATTRLICLENAMDGVVFPIDEMRRISEFARANNIAIHLDGARIWNAAVADGLMNDLTTYGELFDSISLCLSKGLCAPIGSVLVGNKEFIKRAEWFRKQQGGGIRQSGWLAQAAMIALDKVWPTMAETHALTKVLEAKLLEAGIKTTLPVETSMVWFDPKQVDLQKFRELAAAAGLRVLDERIVVHYYITRQDIDKLAEVIIASKVE